MELARVLGSLVADRKYAGLEGVKLLLVQPLTPALEPTGDPLIVADRFETIPSNVVHEAHRATRVS